MIVYEKVYALGSWYGWIPIGGQLAPNTGPGASVWSDRMNCFVEGTNGALYQNTYTWSGWSGWVSLGGQLTSSPTAATPTYASGAISMPVFVRGTNGLIYAREYENGVWRPGWSQGIQGPP